MSKETINKFSGYFAQYAPAVAGALMAWGAMKAEVTNLRAEVAELRASAKQQEARIVLVEVEGGKVGAKLDGILRELQALREDIRDRARNTASTQ